MPIYAELGISRHTGAVNCAAFNSDGRLAASAGEDRIVKVWDVRIGKHKIDLAGHTGGVESVAFDQSGRLLASAGADGTVRMFDIETGACLVLLIGTDDGWVALLHDGSYKIGGGAIDAVWWSIARSRFDAGDLDPHCPSIRWLEDSAAIPFPSGRRKRRRI